jgi:hypothetical protein
MAFAETLRSWRVVIHQTNRIVKITTRGVAVERPLGITVSRHIVDLQRMDPQAAGDLSGLLNELIAAVKILSAEVNMADLADILDIQPEPLHQRQSL